MSLASIGNGGVVHVPRRWEQARAGLRGTFTSLASLIGAITKRCRPAHGTYVHE